MYVYVYLHMFFVVEKTGPLRLTARNILRNLSASPTRSIYIHALCNDANDCLKSSWLAATAGQVANGRLHQLQSR